MSKRKKNEFKIGYNELENGVTSGTTALDVKNTPIPVESLKVLMTGDSNNKFRIISKKITSKDVKLVLKHRETSEQFKIVAPIQFLDYHKIPFRNPVFPTDKQIEGILNKRVRNWDIDIIITELSKEYALVVVLDKGSNKKIACKVALRDLLVNTSLYIEKCQTYQQAINYAFEKINLWRESEWQREIMTKINLLRLTQSTTLKKV